MTPIMHVTLRWPSVAILLALGLMVVATVTSIIKPLSVPRDRLASDEAPESNYYTVDIDEAEKRAQGESRDGAQRLSVLTDRSRNRVQFINSVLPGVEEKIGAR
jgi:hypothetical protein